MIRAPRGPRRRVSLAAPLLVTAALAALAALAGASGCLRRDVVPIEPTTKISFETVVPQPAIDKVDLLVMVDNSSSMADKQRILADAVPDLVRGLVQPKCVDRATRAPTGALADPLKPEGQQCPSGAEPAFTPITDMHIGVISSSLGGMGSSSCKDPSRREDDRGHLLARGAGSAGGGSATVAAAGDLHFLAWYPDVETNRDKARHPEPPVPATRSVTALGEAFRELVVGVGQDGCGLEAQLESVYRFLVQPDPWTAIDVTDGVASYGPRSRVDGDLLEQRAAFLRPDSLVAVVVLSDEDDSSPDPLAFSGRGWLFDESAPLPRATSVCATDPASPACASCSATEGCAASDPRCAAIAADPSCKVNGGRYGATEDPLNVRFHAMKRRFGLDPQFPLSRYVRALTEPKVPSREAEHERGAYVGKPDCTNPLFAARLPAATSDELCRLPRGPRTKDLVYFAVIGGVPSALLPESGEASDIDWEKILGHDPAEHDTSGIDPHMLASTEPRPGLPGPGARDDADPVHGREWSTGGTDLQFACTFDLLERASDGTPVPVKRACDPESKRLGLCDCDGTKDTPLCSPTDRSIQVRGKAYPTGRALAVARDLGDHGVVASLCPKQLTHPERDDYGYRPAARAITERLERGLVASCLPRALERESEGGPVACLVLATLAEPGPDSECQRLGLAVPDPAVAAKHRDRLAAEEGEEARRLPVCVVPQVTTPPGASCKDELAEVGFCYAENVPGTRCAHALHFTKATARLARARFSLKCMQLDE